MEDLNKLLDQIEWAIDNEQYNGGNLFVLLNEITVRYPDCIDAYFLLGKARAHTGYPEAAYEAYSKCIELDPTYYPAYINRGYLAYSQQNYKKAIEDYNYVISNEPSPQAYMNRGVAKYFSGDYKGAIIDYDKVFEIEPEANNWDFLYYNRGLAKYDNGDIYGAKTDYDKAIELNPNGNYLYYNIR